MASTRREARERAIEVLYEAEMKGVPVADVLAELPLEPDPFTRELVEGADAARVELDAEIARRLRSDWALDRLSTIERIVLLIGAYELREGETPTGVVLAEAVELATRYGGSESSRFVNGVLAAIASG